jgi:hypothetical protein
MLLVGTAYGSAFSVDQPITVDAESVTIEAAFSYTVHGLGVAFDDRSSGLIIAWAWSFGDPSGKVSNEKNPTFEYLQPGKYVVTFRITDASGLQDQISRSVSLGSTDTRTLTLGSGALILVVGILLIFRGEDSVKLTGIVVLVVGIAFLVSMATERDVVGRIYDLLSNLWR